jgi:hypothetical protein
MRTTRFLAILFIAGCGGGGLNTNIDGGEDLASPTTDDMNVGDMANGFMCNLLNQDCTDPSNPKCTYTRVMGMTKTMCTADGTVARDQTCTIDMTTRLDNCQKGLVCTATGSASGTDTCRKLCAADGDCGGTQKCASLRGVMGVGYCIPTCTEFGTDCTGGSCAAAATDVSSTMTNPVRFLTCRAVGTALADDACTTGADCVADMLCGGQPRRCSPLCDSSGSHNCPAVAPDAGAPWTCMPVTGSTTVSACQ